MFLSCEPGSVDDQRPPEIVFSDVTLEQNGRGRPTPCFAALFSPPAPMVERLGFRSHPLIVPPSFLPVRP